MLGKVHTVVIVWDQTMENLKSVLLTLTYPITFPFFTQHRPVVVSFLPSFLQTVVVLWAPQDFNLQSSNLLGSLVDFHLKLPELEFAMSKKQKSKNSIYNRWKFRFIFTGKSRVSRGRWLLSDWFFLLWESPEGHVTISMREPAEQINCVSI